MLHKPTARKLPKKYDNSQKEQQQVINKLASKPAMNIGNRGSSKNVNSSNQVRGKINSVEKKVNKIAGNLNNAQLQQLLIGQIKDIKNQLKEIKQQIGINPGNNNRKGYEQSPLQVRYEQPHNYPPQQTYDNEEEVVSEEEENIYSIGKKHEEDVRNYPPQPPHNSSQRKPKIQEESQHRGDTGSRNYQLIQHPKVMIEAGKIQPYMKQFKMEVTKQLLPIYTGYHKKSSKPVVIKYCPQNQSLQPLFNMYEKLWKNIVKAKRICINKVYDLNEPLATYILVIEANKMDLREMLSSRSFKVGEILVSILRGLQFFHECGYLYRNMHPEHIMCSYENNIVMIDLKRMRKFVDLKGKHIHVSRDERDLDDEFISNARIRGIKQGRKDDLESLGYLALFILEGQLPWNVHNMPQVRSKLTLKQLCGNYRGLLEYMITISQMATEDMPDYNSLAALLNQI